MDPDETRALMSPVAILRAAANGERPDTDDDLSADEWHRSRLGDCKIDINGFLWTRLPPRMPLAEAERIAVQVVELIGEAWERYGKRGAP